MVSRVGVSSRILQRRFQPFWLIVVPDPTLAHAGRVYDQVFIDGTYTAGGCLLAAATIDNVIAWHWCKHETTAAYTD